MKHLTFIILGMLFSLSCNAVSNDSIFLEGKVFDKLTHVQVPGCLVEVLNGSDSALVNSQIAQQTWITSGEESVYAIYNMKIPRQVGRYILRISMAGYDTTYADLVIDKVHERTWKIDVKPVYISRVKSVDLDDVVVKATKVKFYHKGDTLVYNADAFQLAEGSMLDALIRQLPGAELRKDGQIYVNGKFVDNLLLNGKDFFRGDNTVMLENLPNYMVSSINVYDKLGKNSKFAGYEMADDKQYVMDVKLKKQYSIGWTGNVEGGGGTKERYLGRFFAMRFTDHSRLAIYGNANNLNDSRKPGENDNWSPSNLGGGLKEQQFGGIDYFIDDRNGKYNLDGNVQVKHQETTSITHTNRKNFLSGGDTYERMVNSNRNQELIFNTSHRLYFEGKNINLELLPKINFHKFDNTTNYSSLSLSKDFASFGKKQLDSLFSMNLGKELLNFAINRNLQNGKLKGHTLETSISANSVIKFKNSPDNINLYADASYRDAKEEHFDHNLIEYYDQGAKSLSDFRNRYFDNMPNKGYHLTGKVTYTYPSGKWYTLFLSYKYERDYKSSHSFLYRLDQLDGWGEDSMEKLGSLPSMEAYQRMLDAPNSYHSRLYEDNHQLDPFLNWQVKGAKGIWSGQFRMPVSYKTRTLRYHRGEVDTTFTKRTILLSIYSTYANWKSNDKKKEFRISYDVNSKAPDMNMYLNIRDTTDPLNITLGNLNLKNAYDHTVKSSLTRMYPKRQMLMGVEAEYSVSTNEIAMGYSYDTKTGIRTFCPDNVNGNWKGRINLGLITPLDKKKALVLQAVLGANYRRNVDFVGLNGNAASRSVVKTSGLQENVSLQWRLGKSSLSFKSKGDWGHTTSTRQDFQPFNAININNGLTAQVLLPWKFQLGTDLTLYSRRGYADKEMNTDDFVWNARLSRSFFKGRILAMIEGFDILGQLNNITRMMNAQAITETYSNVIPRYVMFHISYKLKTMPKKK